MASHIHDDFRQSDNFSFNGPSLFHNLGDFPFKFGLFGLFLTSLLELTLLSLVGLLQLRHLYLVLPQGVVEETGGQLETLLKLYAVLLGLGFGGFVQNVTKLDQALRKVVCGI